MQAFMQEHVKEVRSRSTSAGSSARSRGQSFGGSVECSPLVKQAAAVPQIDYPFPEMEATVNAARFGTSGFSLDGFFQERKVKSCPVSGVSLAPPGLEEKKDLKDFDEIFNTASEYGSWAQEGMPLPPFSCSPPEMRSAGAFLTSAQLELLTLSQEDLRRQNAELLARIEQLEATSKAQEARAQKEEIVELAKDEPKKIELAVELAAEEPDAKPTEVTEDVFGEACFNHIFDTWNSEFGDFAQDNPLPNIESQKTGPTVELPPPMQPSVLPQAAAAAEESLQKSAGARVRMPPPPPAAPPMFPSMQATQPPPLAPPAVPAQATQPAPFAQPAPLLHDLPPLTQPPAFAPPSPLDIPAFMPGPAPRDLPFAVPPLMPQAAAPSYPAMPMAPHPPAQTLMHPPVPEPPAPLGSARCPSVGSAKHFCGGCKPCAFFHSKGCESGINCEFCHACGPNEKKKRQRDKYEASRIRSMMWKQAVARAYEEEAARQEAACQGMYPAAFRR